MASGGVDRAERMVTKNPNAIGRGETVSKVQLHQDLDKRARGRPIQRPHISVFECCGPVKWEPPLAWGRLCRWELSFLVCLSNSKDMGGGGEGEHTYQRWEPDKRQSDTNMFPCAGVVY